jgi:hypothetical protein
MAVSPRRVIERANGTAGLLLVKPLVVLAARFLGPGPLRLRMVKLAHNLDGHDLALVPPSLDGYVEAPPVQPTSRAA